MKEKKTSPADLRLLENHEINLIKWDNCINNAHNGSIYSFSWYLDIICDQWQALIQRDYEAVMPLLVHRKAGIPYVHTSPFARQLGVFSTEIIDQEMVNSFLQKVSDNYRFFSVDLNKFNQVKKGLYHQLSRPTYEFDLISSYKLIYDHYSGPVPQSLRVAKQEKLTIIPGMAPNEFISFISQKDVMVTKGLNREQFARLRRIIAFVLKHGLGEIYAAYTRENNLCAAILFLKSNRKINLLFSAVTGEGISKKGLEILIDEYIHQHAERNLTINFEHLAVPDKAAISKGFGAREYQNTMVTNIKNPLFRKIFF